MATIVYIENGRTNIYNKANLPLSFKRLSVG
jgi:hypothetical protein